MYATPWSFVSITLRFDNFYLPVRFTPRDHHQSIQHARKPPEQCWSDCLGRSADLGSSAASSAVAEAIASATADDDFAEFRRASKCKQRLTPHTWYWVQPIGSVGTSYVHVYADWSPRTDNSPNAEMVSKGVNSGRHAVNGCDNRKPSFKTGRGMTPNYSETKGNALVQTFY